MCYHHVEQGLNQKEVIGVIKTSLIALIRALGLCFVGFNC